MIADLADGVIQPPQRLADPIPGQLGGLACGRVQAEPDVEQAADDPVQQVLGVLRLLREHDADQAARSSCQCSCVASLTTARTKWPLAVGTGLSVIVTGMVLPSLRSPTSRARSAIGRAAGLSA